MLVWCSEVSACFHLELVWGWFRDGVALVLVRSWFGVGLVFVWYWFGFGLVLV